MFGKIVWIIAAFTTTAESFFDKMQCANCSKINRNCQVKTTGWSCEFEVDALKFDPYANSSNIPPFLEACLPAGMGFLNEKPIIGYCCFWSPEMGCQKIRRRSTDIESNRRCHMCSRAVWSSLMENKTCPCGKWFVDAEEKAANQNILNLIVFGILICTLLFL
ncbi:uncharacterized protein LOC26526944 [Drosophila erecta]|uniref:Uncharacterized protein n=1 Tax=Drosophila erecta TaxID=7220 RepID=A0A0Q5U2R9_DROER|nr:uncharacterized protein LOC26526944 [Drosophila erecta]KQS43269.1 uncharacterized protein Dere_GG27120 [Drosophila erecta]